MTLGFPAYLNWNFPFQLYVRHKDLILNIIRRSVNIHSNRIVISHLIYGLEMYDRITSDNRKKLPIFLMLGNFAVWLARASEAITGRMENGPRTMAAEADIFTLLTGSERRTLLHVNAQALRNFTPNRCSRNRFVEAIWERHVWYPVAYNDRK